MAAFIQLDNITIPVANATPRLSITQVSQSTRSAGKGQLRDPRRGARHVWEMETKPLLDDVARAYAGLIEGRGHFIDCSDGLHASTGLGPLPGHEGFYMDPSSALTDVSNSGVCVALQPYTGKLLQYDAQLQDDNWQLYWTETIGGFQRFSRTSDGRGFLNGVRSDTVGVDGNGISNLNVEVQDGIVTWSKHGVPVIDVLFGDLAMRPFMMPDSLMPEVHANPDPMGDTPLIRAKGDIFGESFIYVVGDVISMPVRPFGASTGWQPNGRVVRFKLTEVSESFQLDPLGLAQGSVTVPNLPGTVGEIPNFTENP